VSLQTIVEEHIMGGGHQRFIVTQDRKAVGLLTATDIKEVTRAEWPTATAAQVMLPIEQVKRVGPDTELWAALEEMERDELNQLPVMVDSQCLGMLGRDDLINFLRTRQKPAVP
jgi:CBS domain-containing protein